MAKSAQNYSEFKTALREYAKLKQRPNLIVLFGDCAFLMSQGLESVLSKNSDPVTKVYAADCTLDGFLNYCRLVDLFSSQSVILIKNIEKKSSFDQYLKAIGQPAQLSNQIVMTLESNRIPAKIDSQLRRLQATVVPCLSPSFYEIDTVIMDLLKKHKVALSKDAFNLFKEAQGTNLHQTENEIIKLNICFPSNQAPLSRDDIAPILGFFREDNAFQIDGYLADKKPSHALALVYDLLRRGESSLAVLGILSLHFRKALKVHAYLESRLSDDAILPKLRMPPTIARKFIAYARGNKPEYFMERLQRCFRADLSLKSSGVSDEVVLSTILA
ncbi:MAG: DNA polymerase III subunit delta [Oligoflexales bacterium]